MTLRLLRFLAGGSYAVESHESVEALGRSDHHSAHAERHESASPGIFHGAWDVLRRDRPIGWIRCKHTQ